MQEFIHAQAVYWVVTVKIHPGQEAAFHAIREKLIASTEEETGTLNYEWSLSEDGQTCRVYERYVDCAAAKLHAARSGALVGKLFELATRESFILYGAPDAELQQMLAGAGAVFFHPTGGFER